MDYSGLNNGIKLALNINGVKDNWVVITSKNKTVIASGNINNTYIG